MKKSTYLKEIQKRLPDDIIIVDETPFEYTQDEYIAILGWIKCFNAHYSQYGKSESMLITYAFVSKRIRLDLGHYRFPCDIDQHRGKYIIYLANNLGGFGIKTRKNISLLDFLRTWSL